MSSLRTGWSTAALAVAAAAGVGCAQQPPASTSVASSAAPSPAQPATPAAGPALVVAAAGSLRAALSDVARAFEREQAQPVTLTFGASGLLRDRISGGEAAQVFASANMEHPQALATSGKAEPVQAFARNALCALASPAFSLQGKTLAQRITDADVRLAISTPKADPAGDYAFQMFERIEATGAAGAGSTAALKARALQLAGGPNSPAPPPGRNVYGALMAAQKADIFITYCTNAAQARREVPQLQVLMVPEAINVTARYGVTLIKPATAGAQAFTRFLLGPQGQAILGSHGFIAP